MTYPIDPENRESPDFMNLKGQTVGDRCLLGCLATAIGLITGAFVVSVVFDKLESPTSLGGFLFFEILFSVTLLCLLAIVWAVFRPDWIVSVLSKTALKVGVVVFAVFVGSAVWLMAQFFL